jgi:hypothetical protein
METDMSQRNTIRVHGGIHGSNNKFSNQNISIHAGEKPDDAANGLAILGVAFAALVIAVFFYLRHFEQILLVLKLGIIAAGAIHVMTFIPLWRTSDLDYRDGLILTLGVVLVMFQGWLLVAKVSSLPPQVFEIANRPTAASGWMHQAFEVWGRFSKQGHDIIVENMMQAASLVPAVVLNCLFGLQRLLETFARSEENAVCARGVKILGAAKTAGAALSSFLTIAGLLVIPWLFS